MDNKIILLKCQHSPVIELYQLGIRPLTKSLHEGKLSFLFEIAQERTVSDGMGWSARMERKGEGQ